MNKAKKSQDNEIFKQFVSNMDAMLRENELNGGKPQKESLNDLFKAEREFKTLLLSTASGKKVYEDFMKFILVEKGNILSARVYFRERQDTFSDRIYSAFHRENPKSLHKYKINYIFISWAMERYKGLHKKKLTAIAENIAKMRNGLCEDNLPLAINRAKLFWLKVPRSYLDYMDLIQTSSEGLINAIDKFVPPYKQVFRGVAIGRMTLNMMTDYSATLVKLPPREKRILYRANKAKRKGATMSNTEVEKYVQESFSGVKSSTIQALEAATSQLVNIDEKIGDSFSVAEKMADPSSVENDIIDAELNSKMRSGLEELSTLERKIVLLKYGEVYGLEF